MNAEALPPWAGGARNHLVGAVQRALRMTNEVALLLDGSLAAAVLAAALRQQSDVPVRLVLVRGPGDDPTPERALARHLGLDLVERVVGSPDVEAARDRARAALGEPPPPELILFELALREARLHAARVLLAAGAGAAGPEAAPDPRHARLAEAAGVQLRYPFLDRGVLPFLARLPPEALAGHPPAFLRALAVSYALPATVEAPRPPGEAAAHFWPGVVAREPP